MDNKCWYLLQEVFRHRSRHTAEIVYPGTISFVELNARNAAKYNNWFVWSVCTYSSNYLDALQYTCQRFCARGPCHSSKQLHVNMLKKMINAYRVSGFLQGVIRQYVRHTAGIFYPKTTQGFQINARSNAKFNHKCLTSVRIHSREYLVTG